MEKVKSIFVIILALVVLIGIFIGCNEGKMDGGPCKYSSIPGIAIIEIVKSAESSGNNCRDAVEIIFDFIPDNPIIINQYHFPSYPDTGINFTVGDGKNPPAEWAQNKGLIKNSSHRCIRKEITGGTCTPVIFEFPDIDCTDYIDDCF